MKPVLLDTSFLIFLTRKRPARLPHPLENARGVTALVPDQVLQELQRLATNRAGKTAHAARVAAEFARTLPQVTLPRSGSVDDNLVAYAVEHELPVATLDRSLRAKLRQKGVSVVSLRGGEIWLEGAAAAALT